MIMQIVASRHGSRFSNVDQKDLNNEIKNSDMDKDNIPGIVNTGMHNNNEHAVQTLPDYYSITHEKDEWSKL